MSDSIKTDTTNKQFFDMTGAPVNELPHRVQAGASAFVLNERGEVLLQKREDNGHWGMPGGRADPGESIAETCAREVWEETGFEVRVDRLIGVYSDPTQYNIGRYRDGAINQFVNVCFACTITGGAMRISDESTDIGFFPLDALPEPLLASHRVRIADAQAGQVAAFFR